MIRSAHIDTTKRQEYKLWTNLGRDKHAVMRLQYLAKLQGERINKNDREKQHDIFNNILM
jgi:hypothetical protein